LNFSVSSPALRLGRRGPRLPRLCVTSSRFSGRGGGDAYIIRARVNRCRACLGLAICLPSTVGRRTSCADGALAPASPLAAALGTRSRPTPACAHRIGRMVDLLFTSSARIAPMCVLSVSGRRHSVSQRSHAICRTQPSSAYFVAAPKCRISIPRPTMPLNSSAGIVASPSVQRMPSSGSNG
jgi:hypothetical protein